jgi:hypothetical protein
VVGSIHTQPLHSSHPSVSFFCAVFVCWMEEGNELFFFLIKKKERNHSLI